MFLAYQVVLLGTEYGARSRYSDPSYEVSSWEIIMLHRVYCDQSASPTQSRLAVNGDCTLFRLYNIQELVDDLV